MFLDKESMYKENYLFNFFTLHFYREIIPLNYVENCFIPALFIHGTNDNFILPKHSEEL